MFTTHLLLDTKTKDGRLAIADESARTWRWHSELNSSARCTVCGTWIPAVRLVVGGRAEPQGSALTGAVLGHLDVDHPQVAA
jgi:hypothetical protein